MADDAAAREEAERLAGPHSALCDRARAGELGGVAQRCICPWRGDIVDGIAAALRSEYERGRADGARRVLSIHRRIRRGFIDDDGAEHDGHRCCEDNFVWPCDTVRAIRARGEREGGKR